MSHSSSSSCKSLSSPLPSRSTTAKGPQPALSPDSWPLFPSSPFSGNVKPSASSGIVQPSQAQTSCSRRRAPPPSCHRREVTLINSPHDLFLFSDLRLLPSLSPSLKSLPLFRQRRPLPQDNSRRRLPSAIVFLLPAYSVNQAIVFRHTLCLWTPHDSWPPAHPPSETLTGSYDCVCVWLFYNIGTLCWLSDSSET